jgi:hypothetical protein
MGHAEESGLFDYGWSKRVQFCHRKSLRRSLVQRQRFVTDGGFTGVEIKGRLKAGKRSDAKAML